MSQASKMKRSLDSNPNFPERSSKSAKVTNADDGGPKSMYELILYCIRDHLLSSAQLHSY